MATFLVKSDKQVGVYSAPNIFTLFWLVDICNNPYDFKYTRIEPSGVMFNYTMDTEDFEDCDDEFPPTHYAVDTDCMGDLLGSLWFDEDYKWKQFKRGDGNLK
jgi:hypothetical protein